MKKLLLTFFLFSLTEIAFCQNQNRVIDSLIQVLKTAKEDTLKVNAFNSLSYRLVGTSNLAQAMDYANDALLLSEKLKFKKGKASAYSCIGIIYSQQGNYKEALNNHIASLKIGEEIGDKRIVISAYNRIGNTYSDLGNYSEALKNFFNALNASEEINFNAGISASNKNIGNIYAKQENYTEALNSYREALKAEEKTGDKYSISTIYSNIGVVYNFQGNHAEALKNFLAVLKIAKEIQNQLGIIISYNNIGLAYFGLKNYSEALKNYKLCLKLAEETDNKQYIAGSCINMGILYIKMKEYTIAKDYILKGVRVGKQIGNKEILKESYFNLSTLDSITGNATESLKNYKLYSQIKDSMLNEASNKQISQLRIQYETEKKDQQIKTQDLQLQNQGLQNRILQISVVISIVLIVIIILFFYLRSKRKKKEYEHTLTDLELSVLKSQFNPHFISNSLINIKEFIDQQPEAVDEFLSKFARLMRRVLEQNEKQLTSLKEELETAELYMQIESVKLRHGFDYHIDCPVSVDQESFMVPPLILQPVIENAIWHGLTYKTEKGHIKIMINFKNDLLKFNIVDNGVGQELKMQNENKRPMENKSFGLSITRKRIDLLNKEFNGKGYFDLTFLEGTTVAEIALPSIQL